MDIDAAIVLRPSRGWHEYRWIAGAPHPSLAHAERTRRPHPRHTWPRQPQLDALATALAIKACQAGHRTLFATAQQWVDRLEGAQHRNSLDDKLRRLDPYRLLVIDEIGYLPLARQSANLLGALIARRHERGSIIVTSKCGFEAWGEILGDAMVAAALIDHLVHHATMVTTVGTQV